MTKLAATLNDTAPVGTQSIVPEASATTARNGWREYKLGELSKLITKGTTPTEKDGGFIDSGVNYIKSDAVCYKGKIDESKFVSISEFLHNKFKRSQLESQDILFSMAGAYLGKTGFVESHMLPANTNQALAIIRIDPLLAMPKFIHYYLQQEAVVELVNNMSGQSAQPNVNFQEIKSIDILLPPLPEQKAIAAVLSSLDDKIDLLHRQNQTLEAMAQTLFRQWFIEEAREGSQELSLSSVADFLNGLACQKFPPKNNIDQLPVLKIKELSSGISENSDWASSDVKSEYIVNAGDVIFAWSASLMVKVWHGEKCVLNQHLFKVTSDKYPKWFYYWWCKHHLAEFISISSSHATTMGHIKRGDLDEAMVVVPTTSEFEWMNAQMTPLFNKQLSSNQQIQTLTQLRDTLLPKLMSGEVRVQYKEGE